MPGGAVSGPQDTHCDGMPAQTVNPASCNPPEAGSWGDAGGSGVDGAVEGGATEGGAAEGGAGDDSGRGGDDGGAMDAGDIGNCGDPAFGRTMDNSHGADDDCKYDVTWSSTPICEGDQVYFMVTVKYRVDGSPVTGANARPDVVLNCNHPILNNPADPSPEVMPGTYKVGPIVFDKPGKWVFRFHFFADCQDQLGSPHGHAAFWVQVP
jgi:hypothetical protein